jgi:hypothetical protein
LLDFLNLKLSLVYYKIVGNNLLLQILILIIQILLIWKIWLQQIIVKGNIVLKHCDIVIYAFLNFTIIVEWKITLVIYKILAILSQIILIHFYHLVILSDIFNCLIYLGANLFILILNLFQSLILSIKAVHCIIIIEIVCSLIVFVNIVRDEVILTFHIWFCYFFYFIVAFFYASLIILVYILINIVN